MISQAEKGKSYIWNGMLVTVSDPAAGFCETRNDDEMVTRPACVVRIWSDDDAGRLQSAPLDELYECPH